MSPRTTKQFEEIREIRKKQIMDVAMYLFAEKGYSNTSISLIATKGKISKGLLYNYFTSKEDLLIHIFEEGIQEMLSFFDPNKDGVLTKDEFIFFIHETFNLMSRKISFYKLYFSLFMQPSVWSVFEKKFAEIITPLIKMLTAYYKNKGSKNPEAEAVLMGSLLDGIGFNYVFNPSLYPIEQVKEMVIKRFV